MLFEKTDEGRKAIQTRHVRLTPCQRAVLITVNGTQTQADLLATAAKMGGSVGDVETLVAAGLIAPVFQPTTEVDAPSVAGSGLSSPISIDSVWPDAEPFEEATVVTSPLQTQNFGEQVVLGPDVDDGVVRDFGAAKRLALELLTPLGLRAIQLRRTVEAAQTPTDLREVEPLIRGLLTQEEKLQLDAAFLGL